MSSSGQSDKAVFELFIWSSVEWEPAVMSHPGLATAERVSAEPWHVRCEV